jgi:hypothetical protein
LGRENQRCAMPGSTSGIQTLTATTAMATPTRQTRPARRLQSCNSLSVFVTSQTQPSSAYNRT